MSCTITQNGKYKGRGKDEPIKLSYCCSWMRTECAFFIFVSIFIIFLHQKNKVYGKNFDYISLLLNAVSFQMTHGDFPLCG